MTLREGNLEPPTRHPIDWQSADYRDEAKAFAEMERVFDICHGCRRCVSLCQSFPTLFDLIDATADGEVHGVDKQDYRKVVDQCYLCDLCYMTKCPYVPPHPWNVDFPHTMLRAKAVRTRKLGMTLRNRVLASTDTVGNFAGIPVVVNVVNAVNQTSMGRALLEKTLQVHREAPLPRYHSRTARKRLKQLDSANAPVQATEETRGKVALFVTCYGNRNEPELDEDLVAIFQHNGIPMQLVDRERCCGMPRLEL